jgi:hypothetical protein
MDWPGFKLSAVGGPVTNFLSHGTATADSKLLVMTVNTIRTIRCRYGGWSRNKQHTAVLLQIGIVLNGVADLGCLQYHQYTLFLILAS